MRQFFVLFLCCFFHFNALAANFNEGLTAFNNKNYQQAYKIWLEIANKKESSVSDSFQWNKSNNGQKKDAQYGLSLLYWQGQGVEQDYKKAEEWLIKSANNGHEDAALKLGFLFLNGLAGVKDAVKAKEWFLKAAQAGLMDGQYNVGLLFSQGVGGQKDLSQAKFWLKRAANQGDVSAQKQLLKLTKTSTTQLLTTKAIPAIVSIEKKAVQKVISPTKNEKPIVNAAEDNAVARLISPLGDLKDKKYAIKIAAMGSQNNVVKMVQQYPSSQWRFYVKMLAEKKIYVLLHCCFMDKEIAIKALQQLPSGLKNLKPYVILRKP